MSKGVEKSHRGKNVVWTEKNLSTKKMMTVAFEHSNFPSFLEIKAMRVPRVLQSMGGGTREDSNEN